MRDHHVSIDVSSLSVEESNSFRMYSCDDPEELNSYIMNLRVCEVTGNYNDMNNEDKCIYCHYQTDEGLVVVCIDDNSFDYSPLYTAGRPDARTYYLDESIDWEYLISMISVVHDEIVTFPGITTDGEV